MVFPFYQPFPYFWRHMWVDAKCRHPKSFHRPSPDFVSGKPERPLRMNCNTARGRDYDERCGPQARYWQARTYPAWLWTAAPIAIGLVLIAGYAEFWRWIERH